MRLLYRRQAVLGSVDLIALCTQVQTPNLQRVGIVVYEQDAFWRHDRSTPFSTRRKKRFKARAMTT
jgi:hypothetical protein